MTQDGEKTGIILTILTYLWPDTGRSWSSCSCWAVFMSNMNPQEISPHISVQGRLGALHVGEQSPAAGKLNEHQRPALTTKWIFSVAKLQIVAYSQMWERVMCLTWKSDRMYCFPSSHFLPKRFVPSVTARLHSCLSEVHISACRKLIPYKQPWNLPYLLKQTSSADLLNKK